MAKKITFESALKRLEEIVGYLEEGEKPLEESLKLFEDGMKLAGLCSKRLEEAERKVEILKRQENGKLKPEPFELENEESKEPRIQLQKEESSNQQNKQDEDDQLLL